MTRAQADATEALAEAICICTGNHDPANRVECRYGERAADAVIAAGWVSPEQAADLADRAARAEAVEKVLGRYFDFAIGPPAGASPDPEDVWRLHRDLRAALADDALDTAAPEGGQR